jgi:uncharacterized protein (TIGR04255 family)
MYNLRRDSRRRALPFKTLSKAPINEALIATRLNPAAHSSLSVLEGAFPALPDDYQTPRQPITFSQTQLNFGPGAPTTANVEQKQVGWRFGTKSGKYAVQVRTDWFIFSRLPPYTNWDEFAREAECIWRVFANAYNPSSIQGLSVRYINQVSLSPGETVEKYLKFYINVPEGVPQAFVNYFARIELHHSQDTVVTIQSGLLPPLPESARLLLDIELAKTITPKDEGELWAAVHSLREPKNQIFFGCITEEWKARLT